MTKSVVKNRKQLPPKKMTSNEQVAAAKRNSDAIQGWRRPHVKSKPVVFTDVKDLPKPTVFYDCHRKIHLLVSSESTFNRYLIMGDEQIEVIKLKHATPVRDKKGHLPDATTSVSDLTEYNYDLKKAALRFYKSLLAKSPEAVRELCVILGKPVPKMSEEEKAKRMAKVERMKHVREALAASKNDRAEKGDCKVMTASGFPTSTAVVTYQKKAGGALLDDTRAGVLNVLKKVGGTATVGELRKSVGKPVGLSVLKLVKLGLVVLS